MQIIKRKVERLPGNASLVDDATLVAGWFVHKYIEDHNVILHTADGFSLAQSDESAIRTAIEGLFKGADPQARAWLADHQDRWLTLYSADRVVFYDQEPEEIFSTEGVDPESVLLLLNLMKAGDISTLRDFFA